ncbi:hypothetical protein JCM5350_001394 [Sporobolomyces pararoseus]
MIPHSPLLHSASASSAAGESSFIAFPPPKPQNSTRVESTPSHSRSRSIYDDELSPPERPARLSTSSKASRPPIGLPNIFRRRKRFFITFLSTLFILSVLRRLFAPTLLLIRFKLVDYAYSEVWGFPLAQRECGFRKEPIIFVKGDKQASIVWEIGKCRLGKEEWSLRWRRVGDAREADWHQLDKLSKAELELDYAGGSLRSVYSTTLDDLEGGQMYNYEILKSRKTIRSYSFPFLGSSNNSPSSTSSAPQTLHIACLADNQFNLRTFHSILSRLISTSRSLPSRLTPPNFPKRRPHLLLHAGDNVQNPHDLQQWQTDFWDPMTKQLSYNLGSQVPILLARGNHDWDKTGKNVYVGGSPRRDEWEARLEEEGRTEEPKKGTVEGRRGTFYSFSPHERVRIIVLDSNLITKEEQRLQEEWLGWEVGRAEWKRASLRICLVHTAPWIEWWNPRAWTDGKEWKWSLFVRQRLTPILVNAKCSLLLSGHSHSYSRGFLPTSLLPSFTSETQSLNSKSLPSFAVASIKERSWEKRSPTRSTGVIEEPGIVSIVYGGSGGTLDTERVEDWGLFEKGKWGADVKHHFGMLTLHLAGDDGEQPTRSFTLEGKKAKGKRDWKNKGEWIYRAESLESESDCEGRGQKLVEDWLEWKAVDIDGGTRDRIGIVGKACA